MILSVNYLIMLVKLYISDYEADYFSIIYEAFSLHSIAKNAKYWEFHIILFKEWGVMLDSWFVLYLCLHDCGKLKILEWFSEFSLACDIYRFLT